VPNLTSYTLAALNAALISETEENATFSDLFVAALPELVRRAESRVYGDLNMEIFDRVVTGVLTINIYLQAIKDATWQGTRTFWLRDVGGTGKRRFLSKRSYEYCQSYEPDETVRSEPKYYAEFSDTQYFVAPAPDVAYAFEIREISKANALSIITTVTGTWLSLNMGDVLFAACMVECERWLQAEQPDIDKWEMGYKDRLETNRATLRSMLRADYSPVKNAPSTIEDKP
jgi:hypothetical protein